jgi:hypothetical protein
MEKNVRIFDVFLLRAKNCKYSKKRCIHIEQKADDKGMIDITNSWSTEVCFMFQM